MGLNAAKNRITRNTPHYTYFFFLLTASENVTWHHFHALGVQGQLDQQLLPILDATTSTLGARSLCNPVKLAAAV